jgi:hypothetical protein
MTRLGKINQFLNQPQLNEYWISLHLLNKKRLRDKEEKSVTSLP